jgi:hypothetical protein
MPAHTTQEKAVVDMLREGLLAIRRTARAGNAVEAAAIADLLHNLPQVITGEHELAHWRSVDLPAALDAHPDLMSIKRIAALARAR